MASNYWESTQRKFWTFTKQQLALERKKIEESERNLVNLYPLPDRRHLSIYFYHRAFRGPFNGNLADRSRTLQNGETIGNPSTSSSYSAGLCTALLRQNRDPKDEPSARASYRPLPGLQNGRMSAAY